MKDITRLHFFKQKKIELILGICAGALLFFFIFGLDILKFTNTAWLINEGKDLSQSYIGWLFYKNNTSGFSIGEFNTLTYPQSISVIYTDSIPVLELFFKLFSPVLPQNFQFHGLWGLLCFCLQGALASLLISKYTSKKYLCVILSIPFVLAFPVLTKIYYHNSLAAQWILLLVFNIWIYKIEHYIFSYKYILGFMGIGALSVLIHAYYVPICGLVVLGFAINILIKYKDIKGSVSVVLSYSIGSFIIMFILGAFKPVYALNYNEQLYDLGANLNTLFNSWGCSYFLKGFPCARVGQGEGIAYLGAGMLIMLIVSIPIMVYRAARLLKKPDSFVISMMIVALISIILALGPTISFNDKELFTIPYPSFLIEKWSIFRATGRFINVLFLIIYIATIKTTLNLSIDLNIPKHYVVTGFICLCTFIQVIDLSPYLLQKSEQFKYDRELNTFMKSSAWDTLADSHDHIVIMPFDEFYNDTNKYCLAYWAAMNNMTLNNFYLSRQLQEVDDIDEYKLRFSNRNTDENTLYIVYDIKGFLQYPLNFYYIDGYFVGTKQNLDMEINPISKSDYKIEIPCNEYLTKTQNQADKYVIPEGGNIYGPYIRLFPGTYRVNITGENLSKVAYGVYKRNCSEEIPQKDITVTDTEIIYEFTIDEITEGIEMLIANLQQEDIIVYKRNLIFEP